MITILASIKKRLIAVALPVLLISSPHLVHAFTGPGTVTLSGGKSTLYFSEQFFNLFPTLGGQLGQYGQASFLGNLNKQNMRITFPIASGILNGDRPSQGSAFYQVDHQGGLLLTRPATGLSVVFDNPTLRSANTCWLSSPCLELGATLIENGTVQSYVPNFAQTTQGLGILPIRNGSQVNLQNLQLYLTQNGADLMNSFFGLVKGGPVFFTQGYPLGAMNVQGRGAKVICPPGTRYKAQVQQCL